MECLGNPFHGFIVEEEAIGNDGERRQGEGAGSQPTDFRVQEWLAASVIDLPHSQSPSLLESVLDLFDRHQRNIVRFGAASDEAVAASNVAQRAGHLDPESVEPPEIHSRTGQCRGHLGWFAFDGPDHFAHTPSARSTAASKYCGAGKTFRARAISHSTPRP